MSYDDDIWEAAEFLTEWDHDGLRYKALEVPRDAIDEDDDEVPALMVIGIDSGNVRRYSELFDQAYSRMDGLEKAELVEILEHAPEEVREFAEKIGALD